MSIGTSQCFTGIEGLGTFPTISLYFCLFWGDSVLFTEYFRNPGVSNPLFKRQEPTPLAMRFIRTLLA